MVEGGRAAGMARLGFLMSQHHAAPAVLHMGRLASRALLGAAAAAAWRPGCGRHPAWHAGKPALPFPVLLPFPWDSTSVLLAETTKPPVSPILTLALLGEPPPLLTHLRLQSHTPVTRRTG
jgi:hypothetical protein